MSELTKRAKAEARRRRRRTAADVWTQDDQDYVLAVGVALERRDRGLPPLSDDESELLAEIDADPTLAEAARIVALAGGLPVGRIGAIG